MEWVHLFTWHNETLLGCAKVCQVCQLSAMPAAKSLFANELRTEASFTCISI